MTIEEIFKKAENMIEKADRELGEKEKVLKDLEDKISRREWENEEQMKIWVNLCIELRKDRNELNEKRDRWEVEVLEECKKRLREEKVKEFTFDTNGTVAVKAAFYQQEYIDRHGVLSSFFNHVNDALQKWDAIKYHSPLIALMQASTVGKSKMLWAAGEQVHMVYISLRQKESSVMKYLAKFEGSKKEWLDAHTGDKQKDVWDTIEKDMIYIQETIRKRNLSDEEGRVSVKMMIGEYWNSLITKLHNDQKLKEKSLELDENEKSERKVLLLFVLDEAKVLTEKNSNYNKTDFECLRHALAALPTYASGGRAFGIVTDTASKISNFAPVAHHDNSYRVQKTKMALYPPFYQIATLDTFMTEDTEPNTLNQIASPQYFFRYGRPLWGGLLKVKDSIIDKCILTPEGILEIAKSKLIGGLDLDDWILRKKEIEKLSVLESIAILGPRLCIDVVPQTELASELVASYMSLCYYISDTRESVMTYYPSDPVIAEASAHLMNSNNGINLQLLIGTLISALREGRDDGYY
ncbi:7169_t:CDS:2 [Funneliformis geosporum]|uniref:7169_t:CDS:1 n=1 Tax=Funneliformis geosporum TaxID=1117311 RepID=A0A9W4SZL0_9GLOM|nr:7169_t:CDS:2 [Funneliformis geosporum]